MYMLCTFEYNNNELYSSSYISSSSILLCILHLALDSNKIQELLDEHMDHCNVQDFLYFLDMNFDPHRISPLDQVQARVGK